MQVTSAMVEERARRLLDALDKMHSRAVLSENVRNAQTLLREILPLSRDPKDLTR